MTELEKLEEKAVAVYESCVDIPSVTDAVLFVQDGKIKVDSEWTQRDLALKKKRAFLKSYHLTFNGSGSLSKDYVEVLPIQISDKQVSCSTLSFSAVIRKIAGDLKKNDTQHIEIWSETHCIKCYTFDNVLSKHGKINTNDEFGCLAWSPCQRYLLYVAEKVAPKTGSYFGAEKEKSSDDNEKVEKGNMFEFQDNWGEMMESVHQTVVVVLDTKDDSAKVLDGIPMNICPGQAIWGKDGDSVIFCGHEVGPYLLGARYCQNRKTGVYLYTLENNSCVLLSDPNEAARSPRLSSKGDKLVYLSRIPHGPHLCCVKVNLVEMKKPKEKRVLVDIVDKPKNADSFPGIFTVALPTSLWSEDDRCVIFHTFWRSNQVIVAVDCVTGQVKRLTSGNGCWTVLDVKKGFIIASLSTPTSPSCLMMAKLPTNLEGAALSWIRVGADPVSMKDDIDWSILTFTPTNQKKNESWQEYDGYLMKPRSIPGESGKFPLVVLPHGGPHSVSLTSFNIQAAMFCKLGFAVLFVNYRGSLGFGQSSLMSLPGNISEQDVEDVQNAVMAVLKSHAGEVDEGKIFLYGGSHGGFLTGHLVGQYPDFYRACALRNPVIDFTIMLGTSDIPDLCVFEGGEDFSYHEIPSEKLRTKLLQVSPIFHAHKVKARTMLLLGGRDLRVPPSQGKLFYKTLKANGVKTRCLFYPDDAHSLDTVETDGDVFVNLIKWFAS